MWCFFWLDETDIKSKFLDLSSRILLAFIKISFGKNGTSHGKVKTHLYFKQFAQFSAEYIPDNGPKWPTNLSLIISNPNLENLSRCSLALIAIGKWLFEIFWVLN